jgi:hypothetical protein
VRRRDERVGFDVVVGVAQVIRQIEDEVREEDHEHDNREQVLDRVVRVERDRVLFGLHLDACRVVVAGGVQCPHVQQNNTKDHERQQVVQREEAFSVGLSTAKPPHSQITTLSPTTGIAENRLVITVAPQKDI